jgi:hypothetical protein
MTRVTESLLASGLLILVGMVYLLCSVKNSDLFFDNRNRRSFVPMIVWLFGREGARIIFAALGLALIGAGALMAL